jgi:hypothetical protein
MLAQGCSIFTYADKEMSPHEPREDILWVVLEGVFV